MHTNTNHSNQCQLRNCSVKHIVWRQIKGKSKIDADFITWNTLPTDGIDCMTLFMGLDILYWPVDAVIQYMTTDDSFICCKELIFWLKKKNNEM